MQHHVFKIGTGGLVAVITVEQFNAYAAAGIAILTIASLIPLVIRRWQKFLAKDTTNTNPPQ